MSRFRKLSQTIWHCQYHLLWTPKYRYRILTGELGQDVDSCTRYSETNCPSGLKGGSDFPSPTDDISAGLPHLRLNIILQEMHNVVVSGSGVDILGDYEEP